MSLDGDELIQRHGETGRDVLETRQVGEIEWRFGGPPVRPQFGGDALDSLQPLFVQRDDVAGGRVPVGSEQIPPVGFRELSPGGIGVVQRELAAEARAASEPGIGIPVRDFVVLEPTGGIEIAFAEEVGEFPLRIPGEFEIACQRLQRLAEQWEISLRAQLVGQHREHR